MAGSRSRMWLQAVLLAAPLVVLIAWLLAGAVNRSQGRQPLDSPRSIAGRIAIDGRAALGGALRSAELPEPESDLTADHLEERVDGAADYFRGLGCRRLLTWKLSSPAADLEMMVFERSEGAAAALARDAGKERDVGPGEEASVSEQAILFRRGAVYARLIADPAVPAGAGELMAVARKLDSALRAGSAASQPGGAGASGL